MSLLSRHLPCPPYFRKTLTAACLLAMLQSAQAATFPVTTEDELRQAIRDANANPGANFIDIRANIRLEDGDLPPILNTVTLRGNSFSIDGQGQFRLLVIGTSNDAGGPRIYVQVTNLTLSGGLAAGGNGADGGGGGLGAGGAIRASFRAVVPQAGSLRLNGSLGGDVELQAGTRLQGTGSLLGNLVSAGATVAPGNSIGTLNIGGNFVLDAGSTLDIEIDGTGAASSSDTVLVGGTATLDGTLHVLSLPGDYSVAGKSYTIITAAAVSGQFAQIANDLVFLDAAVDYSTPGQVNLLVGRNSTPFTAASYTYNQT